MCIYWHFMCRKFWHLIWHILRVFRTYLLSIFCHSLWHSFWHLSGIFTSHVLWHSFLVGGFSMFQPLWKILYSQLGSLFPIYGKKKCSKPPASFWQSYLAFYLAQVDITWQSGSVSSPRRVTLRDQVIGVTRFQPSVYRVLKPENVKHMAHAVSIQYIYTYIPTFKYV